jgi:hypothetical protein
VLFCTAAALSQRVERAFTSLLQPENPTGNLWEHKFRSICLPLMRNNGRYGERFMTVGNCWKIVQLPLPRNRIALERLLGLESLKRDPAAT